MDNAEEKLRKDLMQMNKELETSSSITVDDAIERLIRTQKYLDDEVMLSGDGDKAFQMAIDALNHQKWIPCSERLPDKTDAYLCTIFYVIDKGSYVSPLVYDQRLQNHWYWDDGFKLNGDKYKVLAWIPFLEPYKAEEQAECSGKS